MEIETLADMVRSNSIIKGIIIGNKEIKIRLLADDATCTLSDLLSLKNVLTLLRIFQHCSGLKINIEKTQAKDLGSLKIMTTSHLFFPRLQKHLKHLILFSQKQLNKITNTIFNKNC